MEKAKRNKRIAIAVLAVMLVIFGSVFGVLLADELKWNRVQDNALEELEQNKGEYAEHTIVLNNTTRSEAQALAERFDAKLRITSDGKFATLTISDEYTVEDIYEERANRKLIPQLSLDYMTRTSAIDEETGERLPSSPNYTVNDTYYNSQTYLDYVNVGDAWTKTRGSNVTVAVIDTGIDYDHPEFKDRISEKSYNATEDKIVKDHSVESGGYDWSLIEDENGHGTAVAGVIAAAMDNDGIAGIAPDVTLLIIKAKCDENGMFQTSDLVFGLYYAIEQDADVVNMSFGTYSLINPFAEPAKLAVDSDITLVAAAGNDATTALCYPAADENVIGVGALESDSWKLAAYSNYGENVDIVAPGTTFTTKKNDEYGSMTGTSLAAPIVTGAVALYYASSNRYSVEVADVRELLNASAYDIGTPGPDWYFGYGALDINAFMVEERGTVTFDYLTDEIDTTTQKFIRGHALQDLPEPERNYAVFDGWYYDIHCTEELNWYEDEFTTDLTLYASWVNEDDGVPFTYVTLSDNTIEIKSYTGKRRFITIPEEIDGKPVTSIGEYAFANETRLREVNLPSGLKYIKTGAFMNCNNLVSMAIPDNVTEIGEEAFMNNVRLSSVAFGSGSALKTVGSSAFAYASKLARFELPATVTSINGSAFLGDTSLTAITVAKGNTSYRSDNGVLMNFTGTEIVAYPAGLRGEYRIPDSVTSIGDYAFGYARANEIELNNVEKIGNYSFAYSALASVNITNKVKSLGEGAFYANFYLKEVSIGSGLTAISKSAFASCSMLKSVTIPSNIRAIEDGAFSSTSALETVEFGGESELTQIGAGAFEMSGLTHISLPDSLIIIGANAFSYDYFLTEVALSEDSNLQIIGSGAFASTLSLTNIQLPVKLREIGDFAFSGSALTGDISIPANVEYLGAGAFASCHQLTAINVEEGNTHYESKNGVVYDEKIETLIAYPAGNTETSYTTERSTKQIGTAAFYGSWNLNNITLTEGVMIVGESAFYDCEGVTNYSLPDSLQEIKTSAFSYNVSLGSINIPENVIQISNYAFAYDFNLRTITLSDNSKLPRISFGAFAYTGIYNFRVPAKVSSIAQYAFEGNASMTQITFAKNSELESISAYMFKGADKLQTITFETGSKLKKIEAHGLEGMSSLQKVEFGDAELTEIDNYAFRFDGKLQTITLPETLENIGRYAFFNCSALTKITIPESVEHIGRYAFHGATELDVYFEADLLPNGLQEKWDSGIKSYYVGVTKVETTDDWQYATLKDDTVSIVKYTGSDKNIDFSKIDIFNGKRISSIGGYAFYNTGIESITLPETLTSIQRYAFAYTHLTNVSILANVEFIGQYAFYHTDIQSVEFKADSKVKNIEQYAFYYNDSLTQISLPASLETLGTSAFEHTGIVSVEFAADISLTEIPERAFANTKLVDVTIPDSITKINNSAFRDTLTLTAVHFGTAANLEVRAYAFYNTGLKTVDIPANLTYIGEFAFVGLRDLTAFTVDAQNPYYCEKEGLLYTKDGSKLIAVPGARGGKITLPECLQDIGFGAFENSSATEVEFDGNSNILSIGNRAFFGAKQLRSVTVPASVVSIDYYAFANCSALETVTFADGSRLKGIYEGAFYGCLNLSDITLPDSIVEISDFAFYGCAALDHIPVSKTSELKGIYDYAFAYSGITELNVPETVIDIGAYAFRGLHLTSVTIPDTNALQLVIGIGAFADCNDLQEITLPFIGASYEDEDISWFGYIFGAGGYEANSAYVPESLKTVTITEGITFVGYGAFYNLASLEAVNLPHTVTTLWYYAFYGTSARYELYNPVELLTRDYYGNVVQNTSADSVFFGTGIVGHLEFKEGIYNIYFSYCKYLESIIIPDGVMSLEQYAFRDCISLTSINIPNGVTSIGNRAFSGCSSLTSIKIPDSVTSIGADTFSGCSSLTSMEIPKSVESIEENAFSGCSKLERFIVDSDNLLYSSQSGILYNKNLTQIILVPKSVKGLISIPDSVTSIGNYAFEDCSGLTGELKIPDNVTSIGSYAFYGCSGLTSIKIPDSVTSIGADAFSGCSSLMSVKFGEHSELTSIEARVFYGCSGLASINIPDGVTSIGQSAFYDCGSLTSIKIPRGMIKIGSMAFYYCNRLYEVTNMSNLELELGKSTFGHITYYAKILTYKDGSKNYKDGVTSIEYYEEGDFKFYKENDAYTLIAYLGNEATVKLPENVKGKKYSISYMRGIKNVIIPDSFTEINDYAFSGCSSLTSIEIPGSVTSIGVSAFWDCNSLTSIEIPNGVTSIGSIAFEYCRSLTSIKIPDSVTSIGSSAFYGCSSLMSIEIPNGVTSIGSSAFEYCSSLTSIEIPNGVTSIGSSAFEYCSSLTSIEIPNGVTSIESEAFRNCSSLTNIEIPDGVTSIGWYAFEHCCSLASVSFGKDSKLMSIENSAFSGCSSLREFKLPASVMSIGGGAFAGCPLENFVVYETNFSFKDGVLYNGIETQIINVMDNVENVEIPSTVMDITGAFSNCKNLKEVTFEQGALITSIGNNAFENCCSLTSMKIPDSVTSIGGRAFYGCNSLTSIEIPDSVTSIGSCAFWGCSSLTNIKIPEGVTSIEYGLFECCSSLMSIEIPDSVASIGSSAFYGCSSLTEINIPSGVTSIRYQTFRACLSLIRVIFGENSKLTSIEEQAFYDCWSLMGITIPADVMRIEDSAFQSCSRLFKIINNSNLSFEFGSTENGGITQYAKIIVENNGSVRKLKESNEYLEKDDFLYQAKDGAYSLIAYLGYEDEITLPEEINGHNYEIYQMRGIKNVIIPDSFTEINDSAFFCSSLTSIEIPASVTSIGKNAFWTCSSLVKIEIPASVTSIGNYAFGYCSSLSSVTFGVDSKLKSIGEDAFWYCSSLMRIKIPNGVTSIGRSAFADCSSLINVEVPHGITHIETCAFSGCSSLTDIEIPDGVTSIESSAFEGCISLTSIEIPDGVKSIGDRAFYGCSSLTSIEIPDGVTSIWDGILDNTAYYNNPENWYDKGLYCETYLIKVDKNAEIIIVKDETSFLAREIFNGCYRLRYLTYGGTYDYSLSTLTNLETLVLDELPEVNYNGGISRYFGYSGANIPITLKSVVLRKGVAPSGNYGQNLFKYITGVNIYVEDSEEDVSWWDDVYPGWNNGNRVYYAGEWISAEFRGLDNEILDIAYYTPSQVIHIPNYDLGDEATSRYVGWDLDDDGHADAVPATSGTSFVAKAVITGEAEKLYSVNFFDLNNKLLESRKLKYGAEITAPEIPQHQGYKFLGWVGYTDGMTVTGNVNIYSEWSHEGAGHIYVETVVEPTCTEAGYTRHYCEICGDEYHTDETPANGHKFGDWVVDEAVGCLTDGKHHRECDVCHEREDEVIPATGHNYRVDVLKEATCTKEGRIQYTCVNCGDTRTETTPMTGHTYVKKYADEGFFEWLLRLLGNILFGWDNGRPYYYECSECRHIQMASEYSTGAHAQSVCEHELGEWKVLQAATCTEDGIEGWICSACDEVIEARRIEAHHTPGEWKDVLAPTCENAGKRELRCTECDALLDSEEIEALGHTPGEWQITKPATCEEAGTQEKHCTVCGESLDSEEIPALGHTPGEWKQVKEPTCEDSGLEEQKCDECGKLLDSKEIPATGHKPSDWIIDKEATEGYIGHKHKECLVCGETLEKEDIPALKLNLSCGGCSGSTGYTNAILAGAVLIIASVRLRKRK